MGKFAEALSWGAQDKKLEGFYNYLVNLLDEGYSTEAYVAGHKIRIDLNARDGLKATNDGVQMFGLDPSTGQFTLSSYDTALDGKITTFAQDAEPTAIATGDLWYDTNDNNKLYRWDGDSWETVRDSATVDKSVSYAGVTIDATNGFISLATIGGISSKVQLNSTDGLAFYESDGGGGWTYKGGLAVRGGELTLLTDILGTPDDTMHYLLFGKYALYGEAGELYSTLRMYVSDNEASPAAIEVFDIAGRFWPTTDTSQLIIFCKPKGGLGFYAADMWLMSGGSPETPIGSALLHLNTTDAATDTSTIELLAINPSENSVGFQMYAQASPHIDVMLDFANYIMKWYPAEIDTFVTIESSGGFNQGSFGVPTEGAVTQIIDNSHSQHSVFTGKSAAGTRYYGIDLYDNTDANAQIMRIYSGAGYLHITPTDLTYNSNTIWRADNDGTGSGLDADKLDGYEATKFIRNMVYHLTSGVLIDFGVADNLLTIMYTVDVIGNGYGEAIPVHTIFQFYHYTSAGAFYYYVQYNIGAPLAAGKLFIDGGHLKMWFKQSSDYQSYFIKCYNNSTAETVFAAISNAVEPAGSSKVTFALQKAWSTKNADFDVGSGTSNGTGGADTNVNFGHTFASAPKVCANSINGSYTCRIKSVSTTGFVLVVSGASVTFNYIAVLA